MTTKFQSYGADAPTMALKQLFAMTHREGLVMAFFDLFLALTLLFLAVGVFAMVMKKPAAAAPAAGGIEAYARLNPPTGLPVRARRAGQRATHQNAAHSS